MQRRAWIDKVDPPNSRFLTSAYKQSLPEKGAKMELTYLGIDVSKATLDLALRIEGNASSLQIENTQDGFEKLTKWVAKLGGQQIHACMEATGQYSDAVAEFLFHQPGYQVSVVNPARILAYAQSRLTRNKTDQADANLIAIYCEREKPALWSPPPASFCKLQALVRHLDDLKTMRQQQVNRLLSGTNEPLVLESLHQIILMLDQQIESTEQKIRSHIDQDAELKRQRDLLNTIPGIGHLTAARLLGEIRSIHDFDSARQLAAFAGLTPRNYSSGTSVHKKSKLSKIGNANLRHILFMPALSARRCNPIVRPFCDRLAGNGKSKMTVMGAAMRKLLHIVFGVLNSGLPFDPQYAN